MDFERRGNRTGHIFPGHTYYASRRACESSESIREEIEVVCSTSRAFINDLKILAMNSHGVDFPTIAVILFPEGPVTDTQAPQFAEVSQFESDKAVPKIPEGRV